jgi:hypothetical protein
MMSGRAIVECVGCRRAGGPVPRGTMPRDWFVLTAAWSGESPGGAVCPTCASTIGPARTTRYPGADA